MSTSINTEAAVSYAALILADANVTITPERLQTLLKAAGIEDIEPIWTTLFAKALADKNLKEILTTVTAAGPASGAGQGVTPSQPAGENGDDEKSGGGDDGKDDGDGDDGDDTDEDLGNLFDL